MREFTTKPKVQDFELDMIEEIIKDKVPSLVRHYVKKYGGSSINENIFCTKDKTFWQLTQFNRFDDLYGLTKEFLQNYNRKLIPFAYDPGGWHFCLCMDEGADYGKIIINRWTDHLPEEQFLVIADSFEEFINGLVTEEEAEKLGY